MLKRKTILGSGAAVLAATALGLTPAMASAAPSGPSNTANAAAAAAQAPRASASSTINQVIPGVGTFVGSFTPTSFGTQNGQLSVTGLVTGTLTTLTGSTVPVSQTVTTTVANAAAGETDGVGARQNSVNVQAPCGIWVWMQIWR